MRQEHAVARRRGPADARLRHGPLERTRRHDDRTARTRLRPDVPRSRAVSSSQRRREHRVRVADAAPAARSTPAARRRDARPRRARRDGGPQHRHALGRRSTTGRARTVACTIAATADARRAVRFARSRPARAIDDRGRSTLASRRRHRDPRDPRSRRGICDRRPRRRDAAGPHRAHRHTAAIWRDPRTEFVGAVPGSRQRRRHAGPGSDAGPLGRDSHRRDIRQTCRGRRHIGRHGAGTTIPRWSILTRVSTSLGELVIDHANAIERGRSRCRS